MKFKDQSAKNKVHKLKSNYIYLATKKVKYLNFNQNVKIGSLYFSSIVGDCWYHL